MVTSVMYVFVGAVFRMRIFCFVFQESILLEPMYEAPDSDIEEIIITKETVNEKKPPVYVQRSKDLVVSPDKFIIKQTVPPSMKIMNPPSQPL
jgi:hypothetical protein